MQKGEQKMAKIQIFTEQAPKPVARYSQGILIDKHLYVQGIIALDPQTGKLVEGNIETQTKRVFESIRAIVEEADMNFSNIITVKVFLSDLAHYPKFNQIYNSFFQAEPPPVRTTVQAKLPFEALLEVEVMAYGE